MQQKLITFAVPCYNSAAYMRHCIETLLSAGEQAEIILVDDGSVKDDTPAICDEYAAKYPTIVKAIHQENGGHGEGVNQGIRNATGLYYKVVDSDDWLDTDALKKVLARLTTLVARGTAPDMMIRNYVYEHVEDNTTLTVRYTNVFPQNRLFNWTHVGHFRPDQNILMHSVMYRTEVLRKCGMVLPKHTFYVDNIFVYQPLPYVKSMYYMDLDLYRYFIGRADQSVNESIMVKRVDQQLRVCGGKGQAHRAVAVPQGPREHRRLPRRALQSGRSDRPEVPRRRQAHSGRLPPAAQGLQVQLILWNLLLPSRLTPCQLPQRGSLWQNGTLLLLARASLREKDSPGRGRWHESARRGMGGIAQR